MNTPPTSPITPMDILSTVAVYPIHHRPFKVKAHTSYFATKPSELTFCKDKEFYVLVEDSNEYLVSTRRTDPFGSGCTNGFVPKSLFDTVPTKVYKVLRNRTVYCKN